jgi:D-amino-acid dehydrogenase
MSDQRREQEGRAPTGRSVVVAGGGVVGLTCAWFLHRAGHAVTVLERGTVGGGATRGNAGLVCPAFGDPLPAPGVIRHALGGLVRPDSALFVHPAALPRMAEYLVRFAASASAGPYRRGLAALVPLNQLTFPLLDELVAAGAIPPMEQQGYLMAFGSRAGAEGARLVQEELARAGIGAPPGPLLERSEIAELEPALSPAATYGFDQPGERWVDPGQMVDALAAWLGANGVTIRERAEVLSVASSPGGVAVRTADGSLRADAAVIAAGAWSTSLARRLRVRLGVVPGKGYSFSVAPPELPRRPIYMYDAHVVMTPMAGRMRIAGTMEFDGRHEGLNRRRIDAIISAARPFLHGIDWDARTDEWVGPRPMTPDGLPVIGELPGQPGVFVASGHNMMGLTLAAPTGRVVADLVTHGRTDVDLRAFSPSRFGWPRRRPS